MSEKDSMKPTEDWDELVSQLFDLDLFPENEEEVDIALKEMGVDLDQFEMKSTRIFRDILGDFAQDWRNNLAVIKDENVQKLNNIPLKLELSENELEKRINEIVSLLSNQKSSAGLSVAIAYRNMKSKNKQDLAILLRNLEFCALENGIDLKE